VTPAQWLERADHCDRQAEQLAAEGRIAEAVVESVRAQRYREVAEEMRRASGKRLDRANRTVTVPTSMASAAVAEEWRKPPSIRELAKMLGCTHGFLSQARSGATRIRKSWAERIAAARPDMPATKKTWPKGWADEQD
jgi:hypothetical protein